MMFGKKKEQELIKVCVLLVLDILESQDDDNIAMDVAERLMCVDHVKVGGRDFPLYQIVDDWCLDNNIDVS